MEKEWYSVKGLFRWFLKDDGSTHLIEERIVLFQAESFDQALDLAENEAVQYCLEDELANFQIEPVGWWYAYWIGESVQDGVEVFSRRSKTNLSSRSFVKRYYPKSHQQE